jgi:lysophospholipase L1-like esterase
VILRLPDGLVGEVALRFVGPGAESNTVKFNVSRLLVFDGNSLTFGTDASSPDEAYPNQVVRTLQEEGVSCAAVNLGVPGQATPAMAAGAASKVDPLFRKGSSAILVAWEATNHMTNGATAQEAFDAFAQYCEARKEAGWKVVVLSVLPRDNPHQPDFESKRQQFNQLLREHWSEFADRLCDVGDDPEIGQEGDEYGPLYVNQVHLTDEGYGIVARYVHDAVVSLMR